ncbi:MAG: hypothetical protein Q4G63_13105, partial [Bacteroidia bacterium]|nr:hypothetical protein [Bacteroidia bacterium]
MLKYISPMRHILIIFFLTLVGIVLFISCNRQEEREAYELLTRWDALLETQPEIISDSLKTIAPNSLSQKNRAYYQLLKTISDDKTYFEFKSDSLIKKTVDYYKLHEPSGNNYIRALIYQGIVRTRMGITDSTVYEPLKIADKIFQHQRNPDPRIGYILYYFLGNTHYSNNNLSLASKYFNETLKNAKLKNDTTHIFDTYLAIYWNEMTQSNYNKGEKYLDTLSSFFEILPDKKLFILNAQSIYFETKGNYHNALELAKKQLSLTYEQGNIESISNLYFTISDKYNSLNKLDSAMYYGQMAINNIKDTTSKQNYLYYTNIANIAEKQQNFALASSYRQIAFEIYESSVRDRLDTQIMELEKKYDLSEAENIALKSRQSALLIAIIALLLTISITILFMLNWRNRRTVRLKLMKLEHKSETKAMEATILAEEANKRNWLIQLYGYISNRLTSLQ